MYCTACGKAVPGDARFCPYCGKPLAPVPATGDASQGSHDGGRAAAASEKPPDFNYPKPRSFHAPACPPNEQGSPTGAAPASPVPPAQNPALHVFIWVLAVAGVLAAFIALEFAVAFLMYAGAYVLEDLLGIQLPEDDGTLMGILIQVAWILVAIPWLSHVNRRGIGGSRPRQRFDARRPAGVVLIGLGLQVTVALAVTFVLSFFPAVQESYREMMEDSETYWLLDFISTAFLAPLSEEPYFRGIALQFALRAVCLGWSARLSAGECARLRVAPAQFWVANILQAAVFGAAHLNITQGLYTFLCALIFGWLWWRTGQLRWSVLAHLVLNLSSYFLSEMLAVLALFGGAVGEIAIPIVFVVAGIALFKRATAGSDPYRPSSEERASGTAGDHASGSDPYRP